MAKLKMNRIEIVAFMEDRKRIVELLQYHGIVEFSDIQNDKLTKLNTSTSISQFEKVILIANQAKEILDEFAPAKTSILGALNGRRELEISHYEKQILRRDEIIKECYELIDTRKRITDARVAIVQVKTQMDALKIWLELDVPLLFKGTKQTRCFIGVIQKPITAEQIQLQIAQSNPNLALLDVEIVSSFKEQTCLTVIAHKSIEKEVADALFQIGFINVADAVDAVPKDKTAFYESELNRLALSIEKDAERIRSKAGKRHDLEFLIDYFETRKDKYLNLTRLGFSKNTFIISGFIPKKYSRIIIDELEQLYSASVMLSEPDDDEDVPVFLENSDFGAAVESITQMYSVPGKRDIDPSTIMAFFYYLFFGLMLSDAGYGLLMVLGTGYVLKKYKLEGNLRKSLNMFFYSGISTVFWGAMFGSWFGDIIPIIYRNFLNIEPPRLALWFDPITDPIRMLMAAFGFGLIHLFVGLGLKFKMAWDRGERMDAILDVVPVYMLVLGAAPLAAGILVRTPALLSQIGSYIAPLGAILIVLTSARSSKNLFARFGLGLYNLYNTGAGFLSDILSYSRLLALGLATGSIAGVINLMGAMPENLVFKAILLIVVFLIGHPLNMAINLLGAYVHTNRLQFVEFFSKFYEGGGRAFEPLKSNTKYITLKEDI
ncbi:MAG: Archaeal/vacuolar-type H+-ATPase subunit I [Erysipelotrichaceae bacterium]|nr:MAG: Archaeal/vacuolar-type H+-ATPase subunit [Erysipelotrichaceae bacterium]TXT19992.1 MAG: Archaeal/vacuolar-type H+-ATPase subunit I [Erysipelotrichaceae bacterium]